MSEMIYAYGAITKRSALGDGSVLVEGRVAGETLDLDGQMLDKAWLDRALPKWAERGNVRVMHQKIAAGKMQSLTDQPATDDWMLVSKIVDPVEAKKTLEDLYTGYSVGIKNPVIKGVGQAAHPNGRIVGGQIIEVSLVDFPADEHNMLTVHKGAEPTNKLDLADTAVVAAPTDEDLASVAVAVDPGPPADPEPVPVPALTDQARTLVRHLMADGEPDFAIILDAQRNVVSFEATEQELQAATPALKLAAAALAATAASATNLRYAALCKGTEGSILALLPVMTTTNGTNPPVNPSPIDPPVEPPIAKVAAPDSITEKLSALEKQFSPESMKTVIAEAVAPLLARITEMEGRAAPGGPQVGVMRKLSGAGEAKAAMQIRELEMATAYLDHPDAEVAKGARAILSKLATE